MTLIIGYGNGEESYIAGDQAGASVGLFVTNLFKQPKVFTLSYRQQVSSDAYESRKMLIGFTTSFRMGQVLQHHVTLPDKLLNEDANSYLIGKVVPLIRNAFKEEWSAKSQDNEVCGGTFIVIVDHRVFTIEDEFSVLEPVTQHYEVGCGQFIAHGSMEAFKEANYHITDAICHTFKIVSKHSLGVSESYDIIKG